MATTFTERYRLAALLVCGHCGEGQIEYIFRGDLPTRVMCAECSNRDAEAAGRALCECLQYWPWADWDKRAWVRMIDAQRLTERPEYHRGSGPLALTLRAP